MWDGWHGLDYSEYCYYRLCVVKRLCVHQNPVPPPKGVHFQEKRRLRSAIFNQEWRWSSAVVSLESSRPSHNYTHTRARGGCWCQILMRVLSLPLAPGTLKMLFPFLSVIIIVIFSPHLLAKAWDKRIEVCPLDWFKSARTLLGWLLEPSVLNRVTTWL